ncbi:receptor-like serine/threonine-protein kinase SD1-8 [Arabidopsis lyrata subsp. lyrata]|uniref:receptor-like serine/threonine-protein kinase SD1-8 n=1 Tax=Arabidopsis lyrata subsp. lyrata TaxID=81972 RepID=UPI000A29B933|nr:receptor-like serine/threonine-protein kinase SD1-8 [Arabidopsis lyrata subsp. lyrata]|eukprot:XP_020874186.1 receptor-like serine/threonine-protein kinase SD1-8 [Arabidopsis lyrata subsp. lyrata]
MRIVLFLFVLFHKGFSVYNSRISSSAAFDISIQNKISSPKSILELGFFKPAPSSSVGDRWYLGMWYRKLPNEVVWVANRDNPLSKPIGTLKIFSNNLHLFDHTSNSVWSTNVTGQSLKSDLTAELLDNGNLVLRYSSNNETSGFLWQSFDFPTDTLLPDMKLGWDKKSGLNRILKSWKSINDPSTGDYTYKVEIREPPESYIREKGEPSLRIGPWNSVSDINVIGKLTHGTENITMKSEEISYSFSVTNGNVFSILRMDHSGILNRSTWIPTSGELKWIGYLLPEKYDMCHVYNMCGPNGLCDINTSPICNCIKGFQGRHQEAWELGDKKEGCVRKTQSKCNGDQFLKLQTMKLPDTVVSIVDMKLGLKECKKKCLATCNCTAYANANMENGGSGCVIWVGELLDLRKYKNAGQDLYVRLRMEAIDIVSNFLLLMTISGELHCEEMTLETVVVATQGFSDSNKIGQGGFGIVYKGRLLGGQEIAVKRLLKMSTQGIDEFKNELSLNASVQHVNLVQLLGYCFEGGEMILIYEYLENSSLDKFIFDKSQSSKLTWEKRVQIINGISRGLLYLHQDSRRPMVHRDLKPSNILLDQDMIPKISDFGMSKLFDKRTTAANTTKIVGTFGYMSPEYAEDGTYSTKSDVFSFGVVLLEIIFGVKNRDFYIYSENEESLLTYIWRNWKEGKGLDSIDQVILDSSTFQPHQVKRCIQIGLLCVQERAEDRPTMLLVSVMFASDTMEIDPPGPPGYLVRRSHLETGSSSRKKLNEESWTVAEVTYSAIEPR